MSYFANQTLVHKKTGKLAALHPKDTSTCFSWERNKKGTRFIDENGRVFYDNLNDYTHIEDEWGNPYCEAVKKGEFVDVSAKKYLVSRQKKAAMRSRLLKMVRKDAEIFSQKLVNTLLNPPKIVGEKYFKYEINSGGFEEHNRFSFTVYSHTDKSIQFFSPKLSKYFNYRNYLLDYMKRTGWRITVLRRTGFGKRLIVAAVIAERDGKTIYNTRDGDLELADMIQL